MNAAPVVYVVAAPATQALWLCFMGIGLVWLVTLISVAVLVDRLPELPPLRRHGYRPTGDAGLPPATVHGVQSSVQPPARRQEPRL